MRTKYAIPASIFIAASACSQDGAAPLPAKTGTTPGSTWTVRGALSDPSLIGANVLMVGSDGSVSSSAVGESGDFAVEVSGGASYAMHFTRDGEFVGVLTFNKTEVGGTTSVFGLPKREDGAASFASTTSALEESEAAAEEPAAEEPAAEEPAAEEPAAEEPAAEEPAAEEPAAGGDSEAEPSAEPGAGADAAAPSATPEPTSEPAPPPATEAEVAPEPTEAPVQAPTDTIELGDIVIEGGQAVPENNPTAQVDSDGDGSVDLVDGDDDEDGVPDALDSVAMPDAPAAPLTIASVTPSAGQAGVEVDDAVDIAFTAPLDSASITSTTTFVMNAEGVVVSAEPSLSSDGVRVSLEPTTEYEDGATYTVVVTEDVTSLDGRPVAGEWTSDFVIGAEPAAGAPLAAFHVKSIEPLNGANDVSTKVKLQIKFDQEVEDASVFVGDSSFSLVDQSGAPVAGELSVDHKKIRFEPSEELAPGATYVIRVGADIESSDGATLEAPLTLSFQTKAKVGNDEAGKPEDKGGKPEDKGGKPEDDEDDDDDK
ncbi:MAG: Ig-like domain-containing protein, partial [Myxococcales bacterium]|nr:Ig-like domain-containing protein [Myxococcales bacterium]